MRSRFVITDKTLVPFDRLSFAENSAMCLSLFLVKWKNFLNSTPLTRFREIVWLFEIRNSNIFKLLYCSFKAGSFCGVLWEHSPSFTSHFYHCDPLAYTCKTLTTVNLHNFSSSTHDRLSRVVEKILIEFTSHQVCFQQIHQFSSSSSKSSDRLFQSFQLRRFQSFQTH